MTPRAAMIVDIVLSATAWGVVLAIWYLVAEWVR